MKNDDYYPLPEIQDKNYAPDGRMILSRWLTASAAVTGSGHEIKNLPCQDYTGSRRAGGVVAVALADGAGSSKRSEVGAQCSVEIVLDYLCDAFDDLSNSERSSAADKILGTVQYKLQSTAQSLNINIKDLASTLLFVAIKADRFLAGHLGDGVIGCERNSSIDVLSHPVRGEYANETIFTTSSHAIESFKLYKGSILGIKSFALMSDGSAESLYLRRDGTLAPAIGTFWQWLDSSPASVVDTALHENIKELFREPTTDDCSVSLLRQVSLTLEELENCSAGFKHEFLQMKNAKGLNYRLSVLKTCLANPKISHSEIVTATGYTAPTVKNHLKSIADLFGLKVPISL